MAICIYCGSDSPSSVEHYVPVCLGTFRNLQPLQDKICRGCNQRIGILEEQFCRSGPEGFFRLVIGIRGRSRQGKASPFYRGSAGGKPIVITSKHPTRDCEMYWELKVGSDTIFPARQILFEDGEGRLFPILITDELKEKDRLRDELEARGISNCEPVEIFPVNEEDMVFFGEVCQIYGVSIDSMVTQPEVKKRQLAVATFEVTDRHFRAIAKVAFHYCLAEFPHLTGREPEFHGIKHYIIQGGDEEKWVTQVRGQIVDDFRGNMVPERYCHILALQKDYQRIIAKIQFFAGPRGVPEHYYQVFLGKNPERIWCPESRGHQLVYHNEPDPEGYWGRMDPLHTIKMIRLR